MKSIESVKLAIGYQHAGNRPACFNCQHGTSGTEHPPRYTCTRYGFATTAMAACRDHVRKTATGATPQ